MASSANMFSSVGEARCFRSSWTSSKCPFSAAFGRAVLPIALPAAQPVLGTSLAAVGLADDSVLKGTLDGTMKTTMNASASENGFVVRYTNEKGECFNFENGESEKMGDIVNGDFKPKTNAQCWRGGGIIIIIICGGCWW
ncbi:hypothetical protein DM02DRAFT_635309 [Periconia macrospinosa]|uniref:Uncharacterized protein n=1 Tax=Periconia macrospinosa TaxID=97972 RepID=A0A2V1D3A0_9PLEO|nr:hypothetical protein DM02DRAFT_635309 [Periconia macrospinosa]